jgi:pimeloyl-ACP methyl ester carboxylesterase
LRLLWALTVVGLASPRSEGLTQSASLLPLHAVRLRDVTLHYVALGRGEPVVMVHGGLEDYRAWTAPLAPLALHYYAIAYSRRYNFPNRNPTRAAIPYSAQVDADDLATLVDKLHLGPVHLVGHSYGGLGALLFATEHPALVRTLTLSEPPVLPLVEEQPGGEAFVRDFWQRLWIPLGRALALHERVEALAIAAKYFTGTPLLPTAARVALEPNLQEWEVLTVSGKPFPVPSAKSMKALQAPVLLLTGDHSLPLLKRCVAAVNVRFPKSQVVTVRNATHDMWSEKPQACSAALRRFLQTNSERH